MFASYAPTPPDYPPRFVFFRFCFFLVFFSLSLHSSPSPYHLRHHLNHTISCRRVAVAAYLLLTRALIANIYEKIDRCIGHHRTTCTSFFSFFARPTDRDQSREQSYAPAPLHPITSSRRAAAGSERDSVGSGHVTRPHQIFPLFVLNHAGSPRGATSRKGRRHLPASRHPVGPRPSKTQPASKPINKFGRSRSWGGWATSTSLSHPLPPSSIHQPYFSPFASTETGNQLRGPAHPASPTPVTPFPSASRRKPDSERVTTSSSSPFVIVDVPELSLLSVLPPLSSVSLFCCCCC